MPDLAPFIQSIITWMLTLVPLIAILAIIWHVVGQIANGNPDLRGIGIYCFIIVCCLIVISQRTRILALAGF